MNLLKHIILIIAFMFLASFTPQPAQAVGDKLIETVMRSDFIFDRNVSNVPLFPLGYLSANYNDSIELEDCPQSPFCDFSYLSLRQGFGLPVWVGKKNMIILGESLELDQIESENQSLDLASGGLLIAWIQQSTPKWQNGLFYYAYDGLNEDHQLKQPSGSYAGFVGRYRHDKKFHSYWGGVRVAETGDHTWYPYAGFDWYVDKEWFVSMVIPWPSLSYAPSTDEIYRLGASFSGSDWTNENWGQSVQNSFNKIDFGFSYERRLTQLLWVEARVGYTGLGQFSVSSSGSVDFSTDVSHSPFYRLGINLRPE